MDFKEIKGQRHYLYDSKNEFYALCKENAAVRKNWRDGSEGEWVLTDDGYICQVLAKTKLNHPSYKTLRTMIRTVCGSFIVEQKTHKMIGKHGVAENIYAFSERHAQLHMKWHYQRYTPIATLYHYHLRDLSNYSNLVPLIF